MPTENNSNSLWGQKRGRIRKVKIVCTLGPASDKADVLEQLIAAGMDTARLNFSHGSHESHAQTFQKVRTAAKNAGRNIAILADLCGPKIRLGEVKADVKISTGDKLQIVCNAAANFVGDGQRLSTSYEDLARDVNPGDPILLDDGRIQLKVLSSIGELVNCEVVVGGPVKSHKGLNLPGIKLSAPSLTDKDREDLRFAKELGVDYFALSFVRCADDVRAAKVLAEDIPVIAKIEKPEAIEAIEEIVAVADGIMVARGDLGVEAGFEKVPLLQKRLIRETNKNGKLVITATQMLESMIYDATPTRAEVSDVANAVLDGTDAVMLSGETAIGAYPVEVVRKMDSIIREIEGSQIYASLPAPTELPHQDFSTAVADAAVRAAHDINLSAIVVYTKTGHSAAIVSEYRPEAAIIALSQHAHVLNRLALHWGVLALHCEWIDDLEALLSQAKNVVFAHRLADPGESIAVTYGTSNKGFAKTDTLRLLTIGQKDNMSR